MERNADSPTEIHGPVSLTASEEPSMLTAAEFPGNTEVI